MPRPLEDLTYTIPQAARVLHTGKNTVRRLIEEGGLPAMRWGRRVLITHHALTEWLKANPDFRLPSRAPFPSEVAPSMTSGLGEAS